jgi:serine protease AprX
MSATTLLPRVRLAMVGMAAMVAVSLLTPPAVNARDSQPRRPFAVVDAELQHATGSVRVIVQAVDGAAAAIPRAITRAGGHVTLPLPIINGAAATVPAKAISELASTDGIRAISLDRPVTVQGGGSSTSPNSVYDQVVRADDVWAAGKTGSGVTVALLDTGIADVPDLAGPRALRHRRRHGQGHRVREPVG